MIKYTLAALALSAVPAIAQQPLCANTEQVYAIMDEAGMQRAFSAIEEDGRMILEMFADEDGNFTMIGTLPGGVSCLIIKGLGYDAVIPGDAV